MVDGGAICCEEKQQTNRRSRFIAVIRLYVYFTIIRKYSQQTENWIEN